MLLPTGVVGLPAWLLSPLRDHCGSAFPQNRDLGTPTALLPPHAGVGAATGQSRLKEKGEVDCTSPLETSPQNGGYRNALLPLSKCRPGAWVKTEAQANPISDGTKVELDFVARKPGGLASARAHAFEVTSFYHSQQDTRHDQPNPHPCTASALPPCPPRFL